jgi:plastocyanin
MGMSVTGVWAAFAIAFATVVHAPSTIQISIKDLAFTPAQLSLHVGDVIEWVNVDFIDHTATA